MHRGTCTPGAAYTLLAAAPSLSAALFPFVAIGSTWVPALRHDWNWPAVPAAITSVLVESASGWRQSGFGSPNPIPAYLIGPITAALNYLLGVHWSLVVYLAIVAAVIASGAARLCANARWVHVRLALALIAQYNPWTYNEFVAGHLPMLLAFGVTLHLVAEFLRKKPRPRALALIAVAASVQLQFFIIAIAILIVCARRVRSSLPFVTTAIAFSPALIGLVTASGWLSGIPMLKEWQISQSVPFRDALMLGGYAPGYARALFPFETPLVIALIGCAALGLWFALSRRGMVMVCIACVALLSFLSGFRGPAAPLYAFLVRHVHAIGVFRELYDLVAYLVIIYILLAARAAEKFATVRAAALPLGALFLTAWFMAPPSRFWVDAAGLPRTQFAAPQDTRFALIPPFQPLTASGRGLGVDPDAYIRSGGATPLNTYFPEYPGDFALSWWSRWRDPRPLEALSVSVVVERAWLQSDVAALSHTTPFLSTRGKIDRIIHLHHVLPMISLTGRLPTVVIPPRPWESAIFFWDRYTSRGFRVFSSTSGTLNYRSRWVDARLFFPEFPAIAQAWGGILTSSDRPKVLPRSEALLVDVHGTLRDQNNRTIAKNTHGYQWVKIFRRSYSVYCSGFCVLLAAGDPPKLRGSADPNVAVHALRGGSFLFPWLYGAHVPATPPATLRLNNAFAPGWAAFEGATQLRHIRIDGIANGWLVSKSTGSSEVIMVYIPALLQLIAEAAAYIWVIFLLFKKEENKTPPLQE